MNIQNLYNEYKDLRDEADRLEEEMMADFGNEEKEDAWDAAYNKEYAKHEQLVAELSKLINVDSKTARAMIASDKFESIMKLTIAD